MTLYLTLIIDLNSVLTSSLLVGKDDNAILDITSNGEELINTAAYGIDNFIATFKNTLSNLKLTPNKVIGVFDAPKSRSRRQKLYPQYKAHRKERSKLYYEQYTKLFDFASNAIKDLGGTLLSVKETEADDVIAHIAPKIPNAVIWTKDKDLLSIDCDVYIDASIYSGESCEDRYNNILRKHIRLYRSLVGDVGDFGPGMSVKGFGEKAFLKVQEAFGYDGLDVLCGLFTANQLDRLQEDVPELPILAKIIEHKETAMLTWALAGWMPIRDDQLMWDAGYVHKPEETQYFINEFSHWYQKTTLVTSDNFDAVAGLILASKHGDIALDIETDVPPESKQWIQGIKSNVDARAAVVDVYSSYLCGLGLTVGSNDNNSFYFSINHADTNNVSSEQVRDLVARIQCDNILCHNASGFEIPVLMRQWGWVPDNILCTQIAACYVDENERHGLKKLSKSWLGYEQTTYDEATQGRGMAEISAAEVFRYGVDDTIMTMALWRVFARIMQVEGTFDAYKQVESASMYMTASAFVGGISVDLDRLKELSKNDSDIYDENYNKVCDFLITMGWPGSYFEPITELTAAAIKKAYNDFTGEPLECSFRKLPKIADAIEGAGHKDFADVVRTEDVDLINSYLENHFTPSIAFNPSSPTQKAKLLYDYLRCPVRYRREATDKMKDAGIFQGNPSTDEDAMNWAIKYDTDPAAADALKCIQKCINVKTRQGLYYHTYPFLTHWHDGKIHPSFKQSSTTSRRFAPSMPNVNQLPKRSEEGRKVRSSIIPHAPGCVLVSPDFSGQELRLGAHVTQDANFLSCYIGDNKKDLHSITAYEISKRQGGEFASYEEFAEAVADKHHSKHTLAKQYRTSKAKPTNFLSQYSELGGGKWLLAKKLQITEDEAAAFLDAKQEAFPGVDVWKDTEGMKIRERRYASTLLSARKHVAKLLHTNDDGGKHTVRSALNFIIQSSGAEMTKLALGRVWGRRLLQIYEAKFYMPVHDEVLFSVPLHNLQNFCGELHDCMTAPYGAMTVPIESSLAIGLNFGELKEFAWDADFAEITQTFGGV